LEHADSIDHFFSVLSRVPGLAIGVFLCGLAICDVCVHSLYTSSVLPLHRIANLQSEVQETIAAHALRSTPATKPVVAKV
jgi:hypothetical protein